MHKIKVSIISASGYTGGELLRLLLFHQNIEVKQITSSSYYGKFAYKADLVLLLYPAKWEEYDIADKPILKVKYAKNKLSHYRGTTSLLFHRNTSRLEEMGNRINPP